MSDDPKFENPVEGLFNEAADSVAARPHFYRELLGSQVLICPHGNIEESDDPEKYTSTLKMETVTVESIQYVPFFLAEKFLPPRRRYIPLSAKRFFEITKGSHLVLNPGHVPMKTFAPDEVAKLLSGELLKPEKEFQVKNNASLVIGPAPENPLQILDQVAKFFDREPGVLRAWLAWYKNPTVESQSGYLLAIEIVSSVDFPNLAGRLSFVLKEVGTGGPFCDIVRYTGSDFTRYFTSQKPFFSRPLWRRLKCTMFGSD
ncbi:MAG TPA: enhanced serine sensitivity protein SseB C-terminal domain-containing protein [Lacunisphaera sp.]|jgi:hypothetical protein